ncbi:MAG: pyridoxal phosphate-dependent aminotransferase [Acidobacteria bacterium]|nr:pyridoxal phosphate-dependent aminotransferase [Acidobacteriota bacterium]
MIVSETVKRQIESASWIRRMFEEGIRLKQERGAENIFDFTLGNPTEDPPEKIQTALRKLVEKNAPGTHSYMPNAGFPQVRRKLAESLKRDTGIPFTEDHILMTVGCAGAMNTVFKAMLNPGDEVIVPMPFFPDYQFYIANFSGVMVPVETTEEFDLDVAAIESKITPRTRAIILNSPNNPSGVIYSEEVLRELEQVLQRADHAIIVISDEPYKSYVYDGAACPETSSIISNCIIATSWSKTWSIPGERIGYLAISPRLPEANALCQACTFTNRILGFINAPAIWQLAAAEATDALPDLKIYSEKRGLLCKGLAESGYEVRKPQGAFYLFLKTPIPDDMEFTRILQKEGVLAVPGKGFGRSGYIRLSLTVSLDTIVRSLPFFANAIKKIGSSGKSVGTKV